jgi:hypothetical protein
MNVKIESFYKLTGKGLVMPTSMFYASAIIYTWIASTVFMFISTLILGPEISASDLG